MEVCNMMFQWVQACIWALGYNGEMRNFIFQTYLTSLKENTTLIHIYSHPEDHLLNYQQVCSTSNDPKVLAAITFIEGNEECMNSFELPSKNQFQSGLWPSHFQSCWCIHCSYSGSCWAKHVLDQAFALQSRHVPTWNMTATTLEIIGTRVKDRKRRWWREWQRQWWCFVLRHQPVWWAVSFQEWNLFWTTGFNCNSCLSYDLFDLCDRAKHAGSN